MKEITLISSDGKNINLRLNNTKKYYAVEEILSIRNKIYSDVDYTIKIESNNVIEQIQVYVNGENVKTDFRDGIVYFINENKHHIFEGLLGLVQISLFITYTDGGSDWFYSDYAAIMVRNSETNKIVDTMLKYIYDNQNEFLCHEADITKIGKLNTQSHEDFWSQIVLLEEIANVYENSYGYFMANCRNKLESVEILDRVNKLQEISSKTVQYMANHPEYLQNSVYGIKYGSRYFLPSKTMMIQKRFTNDIYENQVVMSFLEYVYDSIKKLKSKILDYVKKICQESKEEDGYIVSSYILYLNAVDVLKEFADRLDSLEKQYNKLVSSYDRILAVKRIQMIKRPEPTAVFMNLPQYNRIYMCILKWFGKMGYDLVNEKVMLNFLNAPAIYEAYTLIKLINFIKNMGYKLILSKKVIYPKEGNWKYKNTSYNNTYIFDAGDSKITLYYQPLIYDEDRFNVNELALYRNNSVSLNKESDDEKKGHYYSPDYVFKFEKNNKEQYLICDAKFSRKSNVKNNLIPDLAYKYLTSVSTMNENAEIIGMFIFYGLCDENKETESFFDRFLRGSKPITPKIEMFPLSESISDEEQAKSAKFMFKYLVNIK